MNKNGGKFIGVRVEEPHLDGCPHWHILVFLEEHRCDLLESTIKTYFKGKNSADIVRIDPSIATAASYVMKYIFNFNTKTDGNSLPDDENHKNFRIYDAHSSTWGGRRIEIYDIPGSSTIWDLLRKLKNKEDTISKISEDGIKLMNFALENDYGNFLLLLKEMNPPKENRRVALIYKELKSEKPKRKIIIGIRIDNIQIITKNDKWKIVRSARKP